MNDHLFPTGFMSLYTKLRRTSNLLLDEQAQIAKSNNLTAQQLYVMQILRELSPESATINDLIRLSVDKQSNASRLVEKLVQKKLVERIVDEHDRRKVGVSLTNSGFDMLTTVDTEFEAIEAQVSSIPADQQNQLTQLLGLLETTMAIRNEDTENLPFRVTHGARYRRGNNAPQAAQRDLDPE